MDNLLEIIVPLIFAAIYFFGNMMSGKNEDESAPAPRRGNEDQEADAIERQRRIQEEIRRKIMERRRAAEGTPGAPDSRPPPAENQLLEQQKQASADSHHTAPTEQTAAESSWERRASARQSAESAPTQEPDESPFSWDSSDNAYESEMQARLQQIEATKRRAEQLRKQADVAPHRPAKTSQLTTRNSQFSRPSVRSSLRDPAAARAALIYAEVLGQPISQRKKSSIPGLSN